MFKVIQFNEIFCATVYFALIYVWRVYAYDAGACLIGNKLHYGTCI